MDALPDRAVSVHETRKKWTLYWRNLKFHLYELAEPTANVETLLDEVHRDSTPIFWG